MNDADLDRSYTALCHALGEVGPARSQLLLAMLTLGWIARSESADEVLTLLQQARERCLQDGPPASAG